MDEEEDRKSGFHVRKEGGFVGISQYVIIAKEASYLATYYSI